MDQSLISFLLKVCVPIMLLSSTPGISAIELAPLFSDHMVLQRDTPLPVWGTAAPGESITVTFGTARQSTIADAQGRWRLTLPTQSASSSPATLLVTGSTRLAVKDVLVGEVWVCAGQSNMEFPLSREASATQALAAASHPNLRLMDWRAGTRYVFGAAFTPAQIKRLTPATYFQGHWETCTPASARDFSAIGYFFGKEINERSGVPVGLISLAVGGSPTEAWIRREALTADPDLKSLAQGNWLDNTVLGPWCRERGHQNLDKPLATGSVPGNDLGPAHPYEPSFLWDAGIARLIPFAIRGVLWYQGESNSQEDWRVRQHERLFPVLVHDWREQWKSGDFPFLVCQLSGIGTEKGYQSQFWPEFRDSQRRLASLVPNTGLIVTSDLGHPTDVHPRNKRDVGHRLALWVRANIFGEKLLFSGPLPRSAKPCGTSLVVSFQFAGTGLTTSDGKPPRGFEIAGKDEVFLPATAVINNTEVILSTPRITQPIVVRYAWKPFPDANLINNEDLSASTFTLRATPTP